jgi:predicted RNA polymerase sigma factor
VRPPSDLDQLADRFVEDYAASLPTVATYIGVPGHEERCPDFSAAGHAAHADLLRRAGDPEAADAAYAEAIAASANAAQRADLTRRRTRSRRGRG